MTLDPDYRDQGRRHPRKAAEEVEVAKRSLETCPDMPEADAAYLRHKIVELRAGIDEWAATQEQIRTWRSATAPKATP